MRCLLFSAFALVLLGCESASETAAPVAQQAAPATVTCDPDDAGLVLPDGFCAVRVAEVGQNARHLAIRDNGDIYVAKRRSDDALVALRDTDGDGVADEQVAFGDLAGTGIDLRDGYLYYAPDTAVVRYPLPDGALVPETDYEVVVSGLHEEGSHAAKPFTFDDAGNLYVNVGAPSNACQEQDRQPGSPAMDPCPMLDYSGGIWRFDADALGQTQAADGERYATGIRNAVALDWNPAAGGLYVAQHGRDMLHTLFPDLYTTEENAQLPAEELFRVDAGDDFGWPYCYYDQLQGVKVLAPEYGGDGQEVGRCADAEDPVVAFPGHYAPNDLLFYTGTQFPERYRNGAFIAFHGSWNRAPEPQDGYNVVFVPMNGAGEPTGDWEVFASGFPDIDVIESPGDAEHRPMGLAAGPDGSLYISDSQEGTIWRVIYRPEPLAQAPGTD